MDIQEMLVEKYLFTKAPAGPHHNDNWSCIECQNKLEGEYDFYPYCISCREATWQNEDHMKRVKEWIVKTKTERGLL